MRARQDWRRAQEQTIRRATTEIARLTDELAGPGRAAALPALLRQVEALHVAARALALEAQAPNPYDRRA